jgi:hypothetical protein
LASCLFLDRVGLTRARRGRLLVPRRLSGGIIPWRTTIICHEYRLASRRADLLWCSGGGNVDQSRPDRMATGDGSVDGESAGSRPTAHTAHGQREDSGPLQPGWPSSLPGRTPGPGAPMVARRPGASEERGPRGWAQLTEGRSTIQARAGGGQQTGGRRPARGDTARREGRGEGGAGELAVEKV